MDTYDGTTSLNDAIAKLYGVTSTRQAKNLIREARSALGIAATNNPTAGQKRAIYQWHSESLKSPMGDKPTAANPVNSPLMEGVKPKPKKPPLSGEYAPVHINLSVTRNGTKRRTTVMLESFFIGALQAKHGLSDNASIRQWLESTIAQDDRFDSGASLTRQVVRLIVLSLLD